LDLEAVVWLEAYLSTYNHILVITSHSQDFMDEVCTNMVELTLDKKLAFYGGNFSSTFQPPALTTIYSPKG
jgi:ATP-binding cassette subfamily F protein 2